jgi:hypothetical protein
LLLQSFCNCSQLFYCCAAVIYTAGYLAYAMVQHEQQQQQVATDIPRRQQRKAAAGAKQAVLARAFQLQRQKTWQSGHPSAQRYQWMCLLLPLMPSARWCST